MRHEAKFAELNAKVVSVSDISDLPELEIERFKTEPFWAPLGRVDAKAAAYAGMKSWIQQRRNR